MLTLTHPGGIAIDKPSILIGDDAGQITPLIQRANAHTLRQIRLRTLLTGTGRAAPGIVEGKALTFTYVSPFRVVGNQRPAIGHIGGIQNQLGDIAVFAVGVALRIGVVAIAAGVVANLIEYSLGNNPETRLLIYLVDAQAVVKDKGRIIGELSTATAGHPHDDTIIGLEGLAPHIGFLKASSQYGNFHHAIRVCLHIHVLIHAFQIPGVKSNAAVVQPEGHVGSAAFVAVNGFRIAALKVGADDVVQIKLAVVSLYRFHSGAGIRPLAGENNARIIR